MRLSEPPTKIGSVPRRSKTTGTVLCPVFDTTSPLRPSNLSRLTSVYVRFFASRVLGDSDAVGAYSLAEK